MYLMCSHSAGSAGWPDLLQLALNSKHVQERKQSSKLARQSLGGRSATSTFLDLNEAELVRRSLRLLQFEVVKPV
jgi:hypothetical protein